MSEPQPDAQMMARLLETVDVGLVVLDKACHIRLWNGFMEHHSGIDVDDALGRSLFKLFPELPAKWLRSKIDAVFNLQIRTYSTWEQWPRLFHFRSSRPLTGVSELMYQNVSIIPLIDQQRVVQQVCLLVYDVTEVATSRISLEQANQRLQTISRTDSLSGLYNRGYWEERLKLEFSRQLRNTSAVSLLMLDIDHFKSINDSLGHQAGDEVIRELGAILRRSLRETDIAGRYGGEEFAIVMPDTDAAQAMRLAERLRSHIAANETQWHDDSIRVTVSIGISQATRLMNSPGDWLKAADGALYLAKQNGRNQVYIADQNDG